MAQNTRIRAGAVVEAPGYPGKWQVGPLAPNEARGIRERQNWYDTANLDRRYSINGNADWDAPAERIVTRGKGERVWLIAFDDKAKAYAPYLYAAGVSQLVRVTETAPQTLLPEATDTPKPAAKPAKATKARKPAARPTGSGLVARAAGLVHKAKAKIAKPAITQQAETITREAAKPTKPETLPAAMAGRGLTESDKLAVMDELAAELEQQLAPEQRITRGAGGQALYLESGRHSGRAYWNGAQLCMTITDPADPATEVHGFGTVEEITIAFTAYTAIVSSFNKATL